MKKYIYYGLVVFSMLFTTQVVAQQDEYEEAITLIKEQLKDPDLTPELRQTLKDLLVETEGYLQNIEEVKKSHGPTLIYSTDGLDEQKNRIIDQAPVSLPPRLTPENPSPPQKKDMHAVSAN